MTYRLFTASLSRFRRISVSCAIILPLLLVGSLCLPLIAEANDPDYAPKSAEELQLETLQQEDYQPLQVFLEVNIFELLVTDRMDIGFIYDVLGEIGQFRGTNLAGDPTIESDLGVLGTRNRNQLLPAGANIVARVYEGGDGDVLATIQALAEDQIVRVHANPILLTLDGMTAELHSGDEVPFLNRITLPNTESVETKFQPTGVRLRITPYVRFFETDVERRRPLVYVDLDASLSTVTRFREEEGFVQPIVDERQYRSPIWVKGGERIIIGSVFKDSRVDQSRGIPLLMDIPLLGRLFRSSSVGSVISQLIIMIRPAVYDVWDEFSDLSAEEQQSKNLREYLQRKSLELDLRTDPFQEFRSIFLDHTAPQR